MVAPGRQLRKFRRSHGQVRERIGFFRAVISLPLVTAIKFLLYSGKRDASALLHIGSLVGRADPVAGRDLRLGGCNRSLGALRVIGKRGG